MKSARRLESSTSNIVSVLMVPPTSAATLTLFIVIFPIGFPAQDIVRPDGKDITASTEE